MEARLFVFLTAHAAYDFTSPPWVGHERPFHIFASGSSGRTCWRCYWKGWRKAQSLRWFFTWSEERGLATHIPKWSLGSQDDAVPGFAVGVRCLWRDHLYFYQAGVTDIVEFTVGPGSIWHVWDNSGSARLSHPGTGWRVTEMPLGVWALYGSCFLKLLLVYPCPASSPGVTSRMSSVRVWLVRSFWVLFVQLTSEAAVSSAGKTAHLCGQIRVMVLSHLSVE